MKSIQALLLNLLIGLHAFIVFFLFFEDRIVVPSVLQVLGRTHPLLLHFPIVLLVLAWSFACFGNRLNLPQATVSRLVRVLLLAGAWCAAITVVAGLLLAKEGGYEGNGFVWHKWTGVALCFLATGLLWYYQIPGNKGKRHYPPFFRAGLSLSLVILLTAGHFGAGLTHGEDYLFEPLRRSKEKALDMETAIVFQDVVYPILQAKCLSCHSAAKAKGDLVLSDTASILKGGKHGQLLAKDSAEESLLIERLLLDLDHEHRMPPKGKPQLTPEELALVKAWVASGADFNIPLATLPMGDTIHQLAVAIYGASKGETYGFSAADAETVEKLNTPYRVVKPVAQESPALAVGFYGKAMYTDRSLEELASVDKQVVSLTLSGMPVSTNSRETVKRFINLRELLLNGTPVDDTWLATLATLPKLRTVGLSGTSVTEAGLKQLLAAPALRAVYVWNTRIDTNALDRLQQQYRNIRIERGYVDDGHTLLSLNDPVIMPKNDFFRDRVQVTLTHPVKGVELRYTLDGSEPDSVHSQVYSKPFVAEHTTGIRVRGYKTGWLSSKEVARTLHRSGRAPDRAFLLSRPNPQYKGRGALTLTDLASGSSNHADGKWLGFHGEQLVASMHFDNAIRIDTIGISVKQDYGSHIYPPKWVEVWGGMDSTDARLLLRFQPPLTNPQQALPRRMIVAPMAGEAIRYLRIAVEPFVPIPRGFPAEGNPAWVFVDEIIMR
ncbi:c-type cytochrome domain-containing protein [Parapedobacter koreensis]|uniref:Uncharacterized membrane protein n=1 Tax=Parapedobacter koreensis TaxID=332977 RepID=A0A1H7TFT3_9SPHI|nr:c-type cytochrome domain-containing protein [Parapedobacter koreensis]SEL83405.1 Uncharacterized membrane protein [Parapedobacter koreensis]